jgi:hypothetical protein
MATDATDLITRLRQQAKLTEAQHVGYHETARILREAAATVQRLEAEKRALMGRFFDAEQLRAWANRELALCVQQDPNYLAVGWQSRRFTLIDILAELDSPEVLHGD